MGVIMSQTSISQIIKDSEVTQELAGRSGGERNGGRKFESKIRKGRIDDRVLTAMQKKNSSILSNPIFRNYPKQLSEREVAELMIKNDFFDKNRNRNGNGFNTHFASTQINSDNVVVDYTSRLMWQQHGSIEPMSFEEAQNWIAELNQIGYANFHDWRLPTLEEAMSLMKNEGQIGDLFQDCIFGPQQSGIWTSDYTENSILAWVVFFRYGSCHANCYDLDNFVRAVRLT